MKSSLFLFLLFFFFSPVEAKLFKNSYLSFEMPGSWECKAFGTDWICHSKLQEKKVEALITATAKIAGKLDTLDQYQTYLQQPKTWSTLRKEQITSEKLGSAAKVFINKFPWVGSIHKNSEVKSYISRYVGTVCCKNSSSKLGILVVLSSHEDHYTKYSGEFVQTVNSLRVMDIEKAIPKVRASQATGGGAGIANYMEGLFDEDGANADLEGNARGNILFGMEPIAFFSIVIGVLLVFLYIFIKSKKRKSRKKSRKK